MNTIKSLIKEAYRKWRSKRPAGAELLPPTEEEMVCYAEGRLSARERKRVLDYILSHGEDEEALRCLFLFDKGIPSAEIGEMPDYIVERVKQLVQPSTKENVLDALIEFAGGMMRVIRTTGAVLTLPPEHGIVPAMAYRGPEALAEAKEIEISKALSNYDVSIKIARIDDELVNLTIYIKDRRTGRPSSRERVSLVSGGKELRSSLTDTGKVEFENVKLQDYSINIVRADEMRCIAMISLKVMGE